MSDFLPYGRQLIDESDIDAVVRALRSDFLTSGPEVDAFEQEFAALVQARHAIALSSATAALHLSLLATGVGAGGRVITSPNTFLASANCAAFAGAIPDFADIDPVAHNLDPAALEAGWREDVKAVIPVTYGGQAADMPAIAEVARSRGAWIIEDASHGVGGGSIYEGKRWKTGGHPWADLTVFSFHPVKTLTTGEGGMVVTDSDELAEKLRRLRSHGVEREPSRFERFGMDEGTLFGSGPWVYEMQDLGYNYRITDIQSALGRSQLKRLPGFLRRRREIVARYNEAFSGLDWLKIPRLRNPEERDEISWHLYTVEIDFSKIGRSRAEVIAILRERGVGSQVLYIPVYLQPWYGRTYGYVAGKCPVAEQFYQKCLSLPLHPGLSNADADRVIAAVSELSEG